MRKRVFTPIAVAIFVSSGALVSALPNNAQTLDSLLSVSARHAQMSLRHATKQSQTNNSSQQRNENSRHNNTSQKPNGRSADVLSAATSTADSTTNDPTTTAQEAIAPKPSSPKIIPPEKEDCLVPPPRYIMDQPHTGYTHPDIEGVCKPYPLPIPEPPIECPDHWYENRMPGPIERKPIERQYFVKDGKRYELSELDLDRILIYCPIEIEYVY